MDIIGQLPILIIALPMMVAFCIPIVGWRYKNLAFPMTVIGIGASLLISLQIFKTSQQYLNTKLHILSNNLLADYSLFL